jgi:hypothetical protein
MNELANVKRHLDNVRGQNLRLFSGFEPLLLQVENMENMILGQGNDFVDELRFC